MFGKLLGAYVGQKLLSRTGRGGAGALGGVAAAAVARRSMGPLALVLAAGYGLKKVKEYRNRQRASV